MTESLPCGGGATPGKDVLGEISITSQQAISSQLFHFPNFMRQHTYKQILFLAVLGFLLFLAACGSPQGNAEDGKRWYMMHNCSACHGRNGNDGKAPHIKGLDMGFGSFVRRLRRTDSVIMPTFPESKLSEKDAADIYAFLKSK